MFSEREGKWGFWATLSFLKEKIKKEGLEGGYWGNGKSEKNVKNREVPTKCSEENEKVKKWKNEH